MRVYLGCLGCIFDGRAEAGKKDILLSVSRSL